MLFNTTRLFAALAILLVVASSFPSASATITVYKFELGDASRSNEYDEGKYEYHCFSGTGVVGTYGQFGYFQGTIDATNVATVNWWETTSVVRPGQG